MPADDRTVESERVDLTRRISAPASDIFTVITDPRWHQVEGAETYVLPYCDRGGVPEEAEAPGQGKWPVAPEEMLVTTLDNPDGIASIADPQRTLDRPRPT